MKIFQLIRVLYVIHIATTSAVGNLKHDIDSLDSLLSGLQAGYSFSWHANLARCIIVQQKTNSGFASVPLMPDVMSSAITNWEYFYDARFGPTPYLAISNDFLMFDISGKLNPYYRLSTLRFYEDNSATVTVEFVDTSEENWSQISEVVYNCDVDNQPRSAAGSVASGALKFMAKDRKVVELFTSKELIECLELGMKVRYVTSYKDCEIDSDESMGAIGGSEVDNAFDIVFGDTDTGKESLTLEWSRRSLIKNYQGKGYVYDAVISKYNSSTGVTSITASDISVTDYAEEYIETFYCKAASAIIDSNINGTVINAGAAATAGASTGGTTSGTTSGTAAIRFFRDLVV